MSDEQEQVEEQEMITEDDLYEAPVEEQEEPEPFEQESEPQEDWRIHALKSDPSVRERFDNAMFGGQKQEAPQQQVDPVQAAQSQLQEVDAKMPQLDEQNMTAEQVTKFMQWQQERAQAQQSVYDARLEQQQAVIQQQQGRTELEDYISQAKRNDSSFKNYEGEFRKYIRENQVDPRLLQNRTVVDMIRKAIGYDHLQTARKKARAPGAPPVDESYADQGRAAKARKQQAEAEQLRDPTEVDLAVANYYRMSVEEYIRGEREYQADQQSAPIRGAFNFSSPEKLRKAGFEKFAPIGGNE